MSNLDGAFAPVPVQRGTGSYYRGFVKPPERFISTQLSGGLRVLYQKLEEKKQGLCNEETLLLRVATIPKVLASQTDKDGKFKPCYPVPLLAGRYKFIQVIGEGESSLLISAEDTYHFEKKQVAIKIMNLDYSRLGAQEADCIQQLNKADPLHVSRTVQLFNVFSFEGHYCLVFELLRPRPLHQYFQKCQFDNEDDKLKVIRKITFQLLQALGFLRRQNVIHADLKPENILFEEGDETKIKVVDFGNAIHWVHREVSLYYDEFELQTLLYRAPEVMFGVPFGPEIDIWSLGCIVAELYIGKPLFLGGNRTKVLQEVTSILGPIPWSPFHTGKFFEDLSQFIGHHNSGGETNAAARTRVYHRKTKSTKVEIGYTKHDSVAAVQMEVLVNESPCWAAKATVTDVNLQAKFRVGKESEEQANKDSGKAAFSGAYQNDEVMLLGEDGQSSF
ncbi:uncharacterized protein [Pocillopora verrucosa]|uniref:uncharacterized protein isoform X7 n=1 Tax=Pocillopora verrucosa TaxID=203993 RepID=UPI003341EE27